MIQHPSVVLGVALLTGCAVGPRFAPPTAHTPDGWSAPSSPPAADVSRVSMKSPPPDSWWSTFNDPELASLVERAERANYSLRDAILRISAARAQHDLVAAGRWPSLSISALATRQRLSDTTALGALIAGQSGTSGLALPGVANPFNQFQAGFDASWEIDLFGRLKRSVEAADADTAVAVEDGRDVLVTLIGDVARTYIELRGEQQRLRISARNLKSEREVLELTRDRQHAGLGNDLDVANAAAQAASTEALIPDLKRQVAQSDHELALLLALEPQALASELEGEAEVPSPPTEVPIGLPADLLRRRPDIRRAEAALHAATARVGVAEADLFPRLTLNASVGYQSEHAGDLAQWASRFASVGPGLELPIFDGGRRIANVRLQTVSEQRTALAYSQAVLSALKEAEDALAAFGAEQARQRALDEAVRASRDALALARLRYEKGVSSFLNVLDAERNLEQNELALASSTATVSTDLVALYKAVGGGWAPLAP